MEITFKNRKAEAKEELLSYFLTLLHEVYDPFRRLEKRRNWSDPSIGVEVEEAFKQALFLRGLEEGPRKGYEACKDIVAVASKLLSTIDMKAEDFFSTGCSGLLFLPELTPFCDDLASKIDEVCQKVQPNSKINTRLNQDFYRIL
jgi:hypothetical protein